MKRATARILTTLVLAGCVARPTPSALPSSPSSPAPSGVPAASSEASIVPRPSASQPSLEPAVPSPSEAAQVITFPTAPPASADWPTCTTFQLAMSGSTLGVGLGNVATQFRLRNVSAEGCLLDGYPGIQLVSGVGALLPTTVMRAVDGDYSFPAIAARPVALAPGGTASFELGYGDNPSGPAISLPYDIACPTARWVRIILPGTHQFGTADFAMAPCEGRVNVSPIYPGANRLEFP